MTTTPPLPYSRRVFQGTMEELAASADTPLTRDDWEAARHRPVYEKRSRDASTLGMTLCARHARRHFAAGERAKGTLCALVVPLAAGASIATAGIANLEATFLSIICRPERSPYGVKEDRTARAVLAAIECLRDAVGPAGLYRLEQNEISLEELGQLSQDAHRLRAEADVLCRRWPGATHSPDFEGTLKRLSKKIDALDGLIASRTGTAPPKASHPALHDACFAGTTSAV